MMMKLFAPLISFLNPPTLTTCYGGCGIQHNDWHAVVVEAGSWTGTIINYIELPR